MISQPDIDPETLLQQLKNEMNSLWRNFSPCEIQVQSFMDSIRSPDQKKADQRKRDSKFDAK
jgi:hypothetical protein